MWQLEQSLCIPQVVLMAPVPFIALVATNNGPQYKALQIQHFAKMLFYEEDTCCLLARSNARMPRAVGERGIRFSAKCV